ncbi:YbaB/EbfC family nucleoid-associated protein [Antrihabitans cavernicola]|nr:YbaB/EbfC family nucleoid-associated protein [Spelaeibacter cavernicola]
MPVHDDIDPISAMVGRLNSSIVHQRGKAQTATGAVTVEVNGNGRVVSITIDDQAMQTSGDQLASILLALIGEAHDYALTAIHETVTEFRSDPRIADAIETIQRAIQTPRRPTSASHHEEEEDLRFTGVFEDPPHRRRK